MAGRVFSGWIGRGLCATLAGGLVAGCTFDTGDRAPQVANLVAPCAQSGLSFEARKAGLAGLGYQQVRRASEMWVAGQVAHIAMSDLERGATTAEIRATFERFLASAKAGKLFRVDTQTAHFVDPSRSVEVSLAVVDGAPSCSVAFRAGARVWDSGGTATKSATGEAGRFEGFRIGGRATGSRSILAPIWGEWGREARRVSGFLIIDEV